MKIINVPIDQITPYPYNNKDHSKNTKEIAKSIELYGFRNPILLDQNNVIIAWHGRWLAARKLKMEEVPCIVHEDLTENQVKELRAADNLVGEMAEYNLENLLKDFIDTDNDWLVSIIKANVKWFKLEDEQDKELIEDSVPNIIKAKFIKEWDVVTIGRHRIMCGDSTKAEHVSILMNWHKADCVRTDPPYDVNYKWRSEKTSQWIKNDKMSRNAFYEFLSDAFRNMIDYTKSWAGIYMFHNHKEQKTFEDALLDTGYSIKQQLIRNKPSFWLWVWDYRPKHELFFYCAKEWEKTTFYGDRTNKTVRDSRDWKSDEQILKMINKTKELEKEWKTTVRSIKRDNVNEYEHPTQKPVELCQKALENSSKADDVILDLFLWSWTLLITCEKIWRICYAMELDTLYIETAIRRRTDYTWDSVIDINGEVNDWDGRIESKRI